MHVGKSCTGDDGQCSTVDYDLPTNQAYLRNQL